MPVLLWGAQVVLQVSRLSLKPIRRDPHVVHVVQFLDLFGD